MAYNYEWISSPNFKAGRTQSIKYIVIHHWDDPIKQPKLQGVLNHFKDPKVQVAAHYVVTGDRIIQCVKESDTAWHSRAANPFTIGIEVDPNVPGNTYATVGRLVREIRERHGNLPLRKHSDFVNTSCPGDLDLARIDKESRKEEDMPLTPGQLDRLIKGMLGREPTAEELSNPKYLKSAAFAIETFWNNGGRERYEAAKKAQKATPQAADPTLVAKAAKYDQIKSALS